MTIEELGLSKRVTETLKEAGFTDVEALREVDDLTSINGIGPASAEAVERALADVPESAAATEVQDEAETQDETTEPKSHAEPETNKDILRFSKMVEPYAPDQADVDLLEDNQITQGEFETRYLDSLEAHLDDNPAYFDDLLA